MKIGDLVNIKAYKSDGTCYRKWRATVEAIKEDKVVLVTPAGHLIEGIESVWKSSHAIRGHYWMNRWYSLLEAYAPDGTLHEIYVNISSPANIMDSLITFTDYELDVSRKLPQEARLQDEDEFLEAASKYGYPPAFQEKCYQVAKEALKIANQWVGKGIPQQF